MAKFCKQCGSPLDAGERFCPNCGTKIVETATPHSTAPADAPRQSADQPHPNPKPYQQQSQTQHVHEDAYADVKQQGMDWKQFKPKLTIGKPEVTFISKRKLIIIGVVVVIVLLLALLQGCKSFNKTTNPQSGNKSPKTTKVVTNKKASSSSTLLKSSGKNGVMSFTLSDMDAKTLSREETKELDKLAREIKDMGSCHVTVIGHADNTGTSEVNEAVSKERARLVANYLKQKGVANITWSGESYNHPVAGNETAAGRAKNRRVEVYVSTVGKYNPYQ